MDYEKKYKETLKKIENLRGYSLECNNMIDELFPELKESENKQSKEWILEYLYDSLRKSDEQFKGQFKAAIAWLEKQGEQNPVWSKEDEKMLNSIIEYVMPCGECPDYPTDEEKEYFYEGNRKVDWLKSLKPQPHWKPTEEQIRALSMAYKDSLTSGENLITQTETLKSLYNDLKNFEL